MSRLALHQAAMPNIFLSFFTFFFVSLLSTVVCDSSFYYVHSCVIIVCV